MIFFFLLLSFYPLRPAQQRSAALPGLPREAAAREVGRLGTGRRRAAGVPRGAVWVTGVRRRVAVWATPRWGGAGTPGMAAVALGVEQVALGVEQMRPAGGAMAPGKRRCPAHEANH